MRIFQALAFVLAAALGGCVVAKAPVEGLGERVLPFASGTTFTIFERADPKTPWKPSEQKDVRLVAGADRSVRAVDEAGKIDEDPITFHALAPGRFIVQARFSAQRYGFAVLQVRDGEALLSPLNCKAVAPEALKTAGMKNVADDCWLEDTKDPAAFLKSIAANAPEPTVKYVPVKPK